MIAHLIHMRVAIRSFDAFSSSSSFFLLWVLQPVLLLLLWYKTYTFSFLFILFFFIICAKGRPRIVTHSNFFFPFLLLPYTYNSYSGKDYSCWARTICVYTTSPVYIRTIFLPISQFPRPTLRYLFYVMMCPPLIITDTLANHAPPSSIEL